MLRALESGTAGLHVPTGDVVEFPTNTSDALTSGGTFAIAGACERMFQHLFKRCAAEPLCLMTGGAGWKIAAARHDAAVRIDRKHDLRRPARHCAGARGAAQRAVNLPAACHGEHGRERALPQPPLHADEWRSLRFFPLKENPPVCARGGS